MNSATSINTKYSTSFAGGVLGTGGGTSPLQFFDANVKSLILTIGAPQIY